MQVFYDFGRYCQLLYQAIRSSSEFKSYYKNFVSEMIKTGYDSLPIVILAGAFTGAVLSIQTSYQLVSALIPKSTIGAIVTQSLIIELAAVISGLVLAGRVGARIATELGTMRVSEQIDALESMGFNSVSFLVVPRVLAGFVMFPVIYIAAASTGVAGGLLAGIITGQVPMADFLLGARTFFLPWDVIFGMTKSIVFGFIITSISCFKGYYASGGAEGVGKSTTNATVLSCIFILLADLLLAIILL
ncbi:phospholipid/cholesterol/gamma-HCH transport system permease protein [Cyclonatronum proteinivorum]|uniref:Phospholipid/cholesterol/gamma-HCH transport system permease protein n=1 Tax=Cyclonatronum proteinivorum TaxID=1457365 RepID=A0A345UFS0_9BACT|nr:ABC transporter permease [Cyclonatronum proteinivorum]AXI99321.1 phospholipid/cholesterol/gamma-HCH transport system permease protein [Cyclonatronum proteinivorum]